MSFKHFCVCVFHIRGKKGEEKYIFCQVSVFIVLLRCCSAVVLFISF